MLWAKCGQCGKEANLTEITIREVLYQLCPECLAEAPCPDGSHKWKGHKNPNTEHDPGEWVCYCEVCGMERVDEA